MAVLIAGRRFWLWRAVDDEGEVLDLLVQRRRDKTKFFGEQRPELQHPSSNRFIGDVQPALGQQILDIAEAEGKAKIQPHGVPDDVWRELVTSERDLHRPPYPRKYRSATVGVTKPLRAIEAYCPAGDVTPGWEKFEATPVQEFYKIVPDNVDKAIALSFALAVQGARVGQAGDEARGQCIGGLQVKP